MATGNTSGCLRKESKISDTCCAMGGSEESEHVTATAREADHATSSSAILSVLEEQIERSKAHWSTLADQSGCTEGEEWAEVSNVEEFQALQRYPTSGSFFCTFYGEDENVNDQVEMEVGERSLQRVGRLSSITPTLRDGIRRTMSGF